MRVTTAILVLMVMLAAIPAQALSLIRDAEIERSLRQMSAPILRAAGLPPASVEIYIINNRSLNAFVAGGRRMFLHTGLLIQLETPEELLGVIAHEAGHIAGGHEARRRINLRNAQGPALIGLLAGIAAGVAGGGDAGTAIALGSQGAITRSILRNSRAEEASADQAALAYLQRARIDPSGLLRVLERFRGQEVLQLGNVDPYILTHPLGTERMSLIQRRIQALATETWPDDPDRIYWHARMRAKLRGFLLGPSRVLSALEGKPETELVLYEKAIALHRLPAPREAVAAVERLIAKRPDDPFYIELKGQILHESGDPKRAVPAYRRAVVLAPDEPLLKAGLGRALLQMGTKAADAEALRVLKEARDSDPADAASLYNLALAYDRAGDRGMASLAAAERYALIGQTRDAVRLARRSADILPTGSPGWLRAQDILKLDTGED